MNTRNSAHALTLNDIHDFRNALDELKLAYEEYRALQETEHAHLSRRGSIAEWNLIVRKKDKAMQKAHTIERQMDPIRYRWQQMGPDRQKSEFTSVRESLSLLQSLLTRILTCDRMNEVLLYNGGYLQSVVAYRSSSEAREKAESKTKRKS
jgi:hypothetical protein